MDSQDLDDALPCVCPEQGYKNHDMSTIYRVSGNFDTKHITDYRLKEKSDKNQTYRRYIDDISV